MTISNTIINAHLFTEKCVYSVKTAKENLVNKKIKKIWSLDKDTIVNGFRNGPAATQHGVNAEYQYIADFNVKEIQQAHLENREAILMTKSPEVNGPHDMLRGEQVFQAKYYNNAKGSLNGCIKHLEKYKALYGSGQEAFYVIPPEQYADLLAIKQAQIPDGFSAIEARNLQTRIKEFEAQKGDIEHFIKPGAVSYEEAQIENIKNSTNKIEKEIKNRHKKEKSAIKEAARPSVSKMFKQAGISAVCAGLFTVFNKVRTDYVEGKNVLAGDYEKEDYVTLAKEFIESGLIAGVSTGILYGLTTTFHKLATPIAVAYRIAKEMFTLSIRYKTNKISLDTLYTSAYTNIAVIVLNALGDAGVNMLLAAATGYLISSGIFIPAVVSFFFSMLVGFAINYVIDALVAYVKDNFNLHVKEMIKLNDDFLVSLSESHKVNMSKLEKEFEEINDEVTIANDVSKSFSDRLKAFNNVGKSRNLPTIDVESIKTSVELTMGTIK